MSLAMRNFDDNDFFAHFGLPLMSSALMDTGKNAYSRGIAIDVKETPKAFEVKADMPGVDKKDVKVNIDGDVLSLSVESKKNKDEEKEQNGVKYHRVERSSQWVQRRVRLPESADLHKITAKMENGVLRLDIPKMEEKVRQHTINVE
jgi:HSP20 family molecular chaperone IbpA